MSAGRVCLRIVCHFINIVYDIRGIYMNVYMQGIYVPYTTEIINVHRSSSPIPTVSHFRQQV